VVRFSCSPEMAVLFVRHLSRPWTSRLRTGIPGIAPLVCELGGSRSA
jgi:hypothetical protein